MTDNTQTLFGHVISKSIQRKILANKQGIIQGKPGAMDKLDSRGTSKSTADDSTDADASGAAAPAGDGGGA